MSSTLRRLTWDFSLLRPFESAWSTFTRICLLNDLTQAELDRLISLRRWNHFSPALRFTTSTWIDFDRFSRLLGTDAVLLQQGFLDQLGFAKRDKSVYGVRHCEECWELSYHCPFFDLAIIGYCPWHGTKLSEPCSGCAVVMRQKTNQVAVEQDIRCRECGRLFPTTDDLIKEAFSKRKMDANRIDACCRSLTAWKRSVVERARKRPMLDALTSIGRLEGEQLDELSWQLGCAVAESGNLADWQWSVRPIPAKVVAQSRDVSVESTLQKEKNSRDESEAIWKALRRHIYRKYVVKHKKCLGQLNCLHREHLPALTGNVCTVAFAYLLWQMKMSNVCNVGGLRSTPIQAGIKRLIDPPLMRHGLREEALFTYAVFFALWLELSRRCGKENFYVNLSLERFFKYLECIDSLTPQGKFERASAFEAQQQILISFPDDRELMKAAFDCCRRRRETGEPMIYEKFVETYRGWSRSTGRFRRKMFYVGASQLDTIVIAPPMMV